MGGIGRDPGRRGACRDAAVGEEDSFSVFMKTGKEYLTDGMDVNTIDGEKVCSSKTVKKTPFDYLYYAPSFSGPHWGCSSTAFESSNILLVTAIVVVETLSFVRHHLGCLPYHVASTTGQDLDRYRHEYGPARHYFGKEVSMDPQLHLTFTTTGPSRMWPRAFR
jgi:hypothetical protein